MRQNVKINWEYFSTGSLQTLESLPLRRKRKYRQSFLGLALRKENFNAPTFSYDPIFDVVGATTFDQCQNSLKPKGVFLPCIMGLTDMLRAIWTSITGVKKMRGGVAINNLERMTFIAELAAAGRLKPVIDRSYPLEQIAEAFKYVK